MGDALKTKAKEPFDYGKFVKKYGTPVAGTSYYIVDSNGTAEIETTTTESKFEILGLDDAKDYYLKETQPAGYNTIGAIKVKLTAVYDEATDDGTLGNDLTTLTANYGGAGVTAVLADPTQKTALTVATDDTDTTFGILNTKGSKLPETGGMGTTLFVVGGGVTMAAAGIYLVSKKRSKDAE